MIAETLSKSGLPKSVFFFFQNRCNSVIRFLYGARKLEAGKSYFQCFLSYLKESSVSASHSSRLF